MIGSLGEDVYTSRAGNFGGQLRLLPTAPLKFLSLLCQNVEHVKKTAIEKQTWTSTLTLTVESCPYGLTIGEGEKLL